ncbi:MAG TPA: DNA repair protein RecO [Anaerovoracaceae bacterium]|nr:DNA repair protein RecO [Anaerovoracaceae bacterium]
MLITTEGIVLRQRKASNGRRIIHLFTREYGLIPVGTSISERNKKKSALAVRPFTHGKYDIFKNRGYYNLNNMEVIDSYYSLGENVDKYINGSYVLEFLDKVLVEEHSDYRLYKLTLDYLSALTKTKGDAYTLKLAFVVKTLALLGIMPELNNCAVCAKECKSNYFSIKDGGIICKECYDVIDKSALIFSTNFDIVKLLEYIINKPFNAFESIKLKSDVYEELNNLVNKYIEYYLDVNGILSDKLMDLKH